MYSLVLFFFFKQKTAYEMRISDWSSDVCSSDLAVSAWEESWKQSDPDYRLKAGRVREKVELLVMRRQGAPLSPHDALALAKQARAEVETEMKAFLPKRQEVRHVTGQAASPSRPTPTTTLEAIKMTIGPATA